MDFHIIERLGGGCRCATLFTFAVHFLHALFSVVNYLAWVRQDDAAVSTSTKHAYLSMTVVCCVFYFLGASVFYMWAWRFPEPEEVAKRRRVYGVAVNAVFCDIPMFIVETVIVWQLRFAAAIQGFTYVLTCISLCYSLLRVWFFFMVRVIKFRLPSAARLGANYPALSGVARRDLDELEYNHHMAGMRGSGNEANRRAGNMTDDAFVAEMRAAEVGDTILLNRNAAAYSDDGAGGTPGRGGGRGMYSTPARPSRGTRSGGGGGGGGDNNGEDYYYNYGPAAAAMTGTAPSRYAHQSARFDDVEEQPRQGYYGRRGENGDFQGAPFRI